MTRIGVVGVGTIAEAVVRALCERPRSLESTDDVQIILSPRSAERSARLVRDFSQCRLAESNQQVVDESDIVVISMRPQEMDAALAELTFRADQTIASFVAAAPPAELLPLVAPATAVCQLIPLPAIALCKGPLVISPPLPEVMAAFAGLGDLVPFEDESRIRVLSCASAFMSTYYEMQNSVVQWMVEQGIDEATAYQYVTAELEGLAAVGKTTAALDRHALPQEHQTPGGLNEQVRAGLLEADWFAELVGQMDGIYRGAVLRKVDGEKSAE